MQTIFKDLQPINTIFKTSSLWKGIVWGASVTEREHAQLQTVSQGQCHHSHLSHYPQEIVLTQFSLYVHGCGLKSQFLIIHSRHRSIFFHSKLSILNPSLLNLKTTVKCLTIIHHLRTVISRSSTEMANPVKVHLAVSTTFGPIFGELCIDLQIVCLTLS